jgi:phage shock protein E
MGDNMLYKDLLKKINENNGFLVDVRSVQSYNSFHINNAISIPLEQIPLVIESIFPNKKTHLFIICDYGIKSNKAVDLLHNKGYENITNINKISNIIFD